MLCCFSAAVEKMKLIRVVCSDGGDDGGNSDEERTGVFRRKD